MMRLFALAARSTVDARRVADHRRRDGGELFELPHLALQPRGLKRAVGDQDQPVGLERLFDEIVSPLLDGGDRGFDVAVTGDHHHRHVGVVLLDDFQQLQAVELAALHPDIEKHHARPPVGDLGDRTVAVARGARAESLILQDARDQVAYVGLIIDDQDIVGHGLYFASLLGSCCSFGICGGGF
jgi:hypothetical protein